MKMSAKVKLRLHAISGACFVLATMSAYEWVAYGRILTGLDYRSAAAGLIGLFVWTTITWSWSVEQTLEAKDSKK